MLIVSANGWPFDPTSRDELVTFLLRVSKDSEVPVEDRRTAAFCLIDLTAQAYEMVLDQATNDCDALRRTGLLSYNRGQYTRARPPAAIPILK